MGKFKIKKAKYKKDSVSYVINALKEIHEAQDHEYPPEEVERLLLIEKELAIVTGRLKEQAEIFQSRIDDISRVLGAVVELIAEPTFKLICRVSEFGWYLSPKVVNEFPLYQLDYLLQQENLLELETFIIKDSSRLIEDTLNETIQAYPDRKKVLLEIQKCFENEFYSATITLAYSQVDGMCDEVFGFGFFDKNKIGSDYKLKTYEKFENLNNSLITLFCKQLSIKENEITMYSKPIKCNSSDKAKASFNRHLVLHGYSYDYGNKKNAVRAILMVGFLLFLKEVKDMSINTK